MRKDFMSADSSVPVFPRRHDTQEFTPTESSGLRQQLLEARAAAGAVGVWVLESKLGEDGSLQRTPLAPLPFRIGRAAGLELSLQSSHVSKTHAEIYSDGLTLRVRDLGSRNGTFLNREPVKDSVLHDGDVLHVGDYEFRVARDVVEDDAPDTEGTLLNTTPLSRHFVSGAVKVRELIDRAAVTMLFQPIVILPGSRVTAYEALGRGRHPDLPEGPVELFEMAGGLGPEAQAELSRLFRRKAVELVKDRPEPLLLFVNTHPMELERPELLLKSLEELRSYAPQVDLVLEIHESALAETAKITWLRNSLMEINVGLAYDDFGAGQARLFELAEAPPQYLKFDRRFVTGLHSAPITRQRLVASLVAAARELLVKTIAEGVEDQHEAEACERAGFLFGQGYHFARPMPIETFA
jgi:EAL domain-containing protein (putative c-di-GMP-specific phosphodiesterase class I)